LSDELHAEYREGCGDMEAERFWEGHYRGRERVWSRRPNPVLVDVVGSLRPGTVLDLGCGEDPGLLPGEGQLGRSELRHLAPCAQPGEGQGRVYATGDDEVRALRQVFQQEGDGPMDVFGVDTVVVVEDEVELARRCGNLLEEGPVRASISSAVMASSLNSRRIPREGSSMSAPLLSKMVMVPSLWRLASCWKAKRSPSPITKLLLFPPRRQITSPLSRSTL
jgi:hypothetical protein